ncbi:MAG: TadE/TadG family type IV pilus assembly protein, partial [Pseudomonadota bacterium]
IKSFGRDRSGVAALEFAIISPILILLFVGTIEVSLAVAVDRKVSRVSSAVADLVTQHNSQDLDQDFLQAMSNIADRIIYPYEDDMTIVLTGIEIDGSGIATVAWSWASGGGTALAVGSSYTVPSSIVVNDSYLLAAKVETDHEPAFSFISYENGRFSLDDSVIELSEEMFLRPRMFASQTCSDCT